MLPLSLPSVQNTHAPHRPRTRLEDSVHICPSSDASCDGGAPPTRRDRRKGRVEKQPPGRQLLARQRRRVVSSQPLLDGGCMSSSKCTSCSVTSLLDRKHLSSGICSVRRFHQAPKRTFPQEQATEIATFCSQDQSHLNQVAAKVVCKGSLGSVIAHTCLEAAAICQDHQLPHELPASMSMCREHHSAVADTTISTCTGRSKRTCSEHACR